MSRIGKRVIEIPKGVEVSVAGGHVKVKGPKGLLERDFHETVDIVQEGDTLEVRLKDETKANRRFHGLSRTLLSNMVVGCSTGFAKSLSLIGVGYRASLEGKGLKLLLGYSHPINVPAVEGIEFKVDKNTSITISGASKEVVGQVAANIRALRPPEPYHGKGVRYTDERVATKVGKASGKK